MHVHDSLRASLDLRQELVGVLKHYVDLLWHWLLFQVANLTQNDRVPLVLLCEVLAKIVITYAVLGTLVSSALLNAPWKPTSIAS